MDRQLGQLLRELFFLYEKVFKYGALIPVIEYSLLCIVLVSLFMGTFFVILE